MRIKRWDTSKGLSRLDNGSLEKCGRRQTEDKNGEKVDFEEFVVSCVRDACCVRQLGKGRRKVNEWSDEEIK